MLRRSSICRISRHLIAALLLVAFSPSEAREVRKRELVPGGPIPEQLERRGSYVNRYGEDVQAPSRSLIGDAPDGATARCGDGTFSFSHSHAGTCSRHGGVDQWLR
jgi:hypothetical protein